VSSPSLYNPFADDRLTDAALFNPALDVPSLHQEASGVLHDLIERARSLDEPDGQAKVIILCSLPGLGKTHVFGRIRHQCAEHVLFVYVPQVEEYGSPVKHVHWHILDTLFRAPPGHRPFLHGLLARLCQPSFRRFFDFLPHTVKQQQQALRDRLDDRPETVLDIVREAKEIAPYLALADSIADRLANLPPEVVRALALGWSPRATEAWSWLRGGSLDDAVLAELKLPEGEPTTSSLLQTLAGVLKRLGMVLVICCDQSEQLLERPSAFKELTTALMGWLDKIPNVVLALSFLRDRWKSLDPAYNSFIDRCRTIDLETLTGPQAVELIHRRLTGWSVKRRDKGLLWPFREDDILRFVEKEPVSARELLKRCHDVLDPWLAKRSDKELVINNGGKKKPLEELFRQEWATTLDRVRKEQLAPENLQEERLFRAAFEAIQFARLAGTPIGGLEMLQVQPGALANPDRYKSLQLKLGVKGNQDAITLVVAASNLTGGVAMTGFLKALEQAVADPVAGAVLVRPSAQLTLGPKTEARKKYEALISRGKLRPFALTDHRPAFEQMECYLRLLDRAQNKDLQLGTEMLTPEQSRQLAVKTQLLSGLPLFDKIFCGWPQAAAVAVRRETPTPVAEATTAPAGPVRDDGAARPAPVPTTKLAEPEAHRSDGSSWADKLLQAVTAKLIEFGQKVEPLGVEIGPTFARLRLKPLGRTSVGRVRNHANDLRAHIAGITTVPVIADQSGYISVDVQRPDRQPVLLTDCLRSASATHEGQPVFPIGVDVTGQPHWLNLADPATCHILAAGTTGSGKSEFLKAMLAGLAARLSPLELKFALVDPKHVTFNFSGNSPYLLHPVAHSVEEAMPLVQGCFAETERRYKILEARGLEHIGQLRGKDAEPRIVVVFDEFADLMAERESRKDLETSLKRIGALARAAGIHLVLATQRPDKDVVTPLLKANLPTRVCLRVEGERNSKIILDDEGGENLLGHGDLLWKHGGGMIRLQGAFVDKVDLQKLLRLTP
jgi:DNA segregation ATPase FtsK/SpoIIIE-like protein